MRRLLLLAPPFLWLLAFVAAPVAILLAIALAEPAMGVPPFTPPLAWDGEGPRWRGTLLSFAILAEDRFYLDAFLRSLRVAFLSALLCLLLAYPMALGILRARPSRRLPLLLLVLLPFWTGFLLRIGAWIGLLRDEGWLNGVLRGLGLIEAPVPMLYTDLALYLGMVHSYLPFAVLPLYAALSRLDPALEEAAADLGARPAVAFLTVTLPLSFPGALAGFLLVFIPAAGEFVIPELLGPPEAQLVGRVLWTEFFQNRDWPLAAALAVALLALLVLPIRLFQRLEARP
ncbi:ABC transporter permease [Crenalkalicoccus roseus]|uniref:ABC transporter permease n=1 Tax=Crenalkalicoccus roseus TaxID=1485588 RepID=UPI001081D6DA|nr:ABC transporter permease subunit [Crenalkalicoccus roseus]